MGMICVERATGRFREWARCGEPPAYDPAVHELLPAEAPPPDGTYWTGTDWTPLPPKTSAEKDGELQAFLDSAGGKALKSLATALMKKGLVTLAEIRTEYRSL